MGEQVDHATWDFAAGIDHATNFFPDHRATLLRQMQLAAARDAGLPIFDFGLHWEVRSTLSAKLGLRRRASMRIQTKFTRTSQGAAGLIVADPSSYLVARSMRTACYMPCVAVAIDDADDRSSGSSPSRTAISRVLRQRPETARRCTSSSSS